MRWSKDRDRFVQKDFPGTGPNSSDAYVDYTDQELWKFGLEQAKAFHDVVNNISPKLVDIDIVYNSSGLPSNKLTYSDGSVVCDLPQHSRPPMSHLVGKPFDEAAWIRKNPRPVQRAAKKYKYDPNSEAARNDPTLYYDSSSLFSKFLVMWLVIVIILAFVVGLLTL